MFFLVRHVFGGKLNLILIQVTISKDDTVVLDGAGEKKAIEERCEQVCFAKYNGEFSI